MESVGELLRKARESQGKSIGDVAKITKMSPSTIEALEEDRYSAFPSLVYVKSHIRTYAKYLGLDEHTVLDRYLRLTQEQETKEPDEWDTVELEYSQRKKKSSARWLFVLAAVAVVVAAVVIGTIVVRSRGTSDEPAPATVAPGVAARDSTIEYSKLELVTKATQRTWVRVVADGRSAGDATLAAGEEKAWKADREFVLDVGNGGGLDLYLNGEYLGTAGTGPRVVEDLVVNENGLSQ